MARRLPRSSPTLQTALLAALRREAPRSISLRDDDTCTTIASYNVHKCVGTDGRFDPGRIAAVIDEVDADIIALQEADERTGSRQGLLDLDALRERTGLTPVYAPKNRLSHGWHGNLVLARSSVVQEVRPLNLPSLEPRGAIIVDLALKGVELRVIAAHFGLLRRSRSMQASALVEATRSVLRPTLLLGDLNEWRVRNRSALLGLFPHFGPLHASIPSFPSRFPLLALDRILARPADIISRIEVHQSPLARVASDHLPLKARLSLDHIRLGQQPPPGV
jgi:endonuclease/exonuclease/phosphatase family metal-dependent hydrolase